MSCASSGLSSTCRIRRRFFDADEAGDVADLKLGHDSAPVGVDARRLYADRRRDFLARPAVHDELQDLAFARAEPAQRSCFHILFFIAAESGDDSRDRRQCLSSTTYGTDSLCLYALLHGILPGTAVPGY